MTTETTTRLADIRRSCKSVLTRPGDYTVVHGQNAADIEWLLAQLDAKDAEIARVIEQSALLIEEVRVAYRQQLDDATIRGDKLYQYGQTADAAYAELARILRETEEQADGMAARAIATLRQQCDDYADRVWALEAENLKLRERAEKAEAVCRCHPFDSPEDPELTRLTN